MNVGTLAERSRLPLLTSLANLHLSCKYVGASLREIWYINTASLKSIRRLTGNQWSSINQINQIKIYIAPYVHEDSEALQDWCDVFCCV